MRVLPDQLALLLHWMEERERARLGREAGDPWPWTTDEILQEWRFCNVDRNRDRETVWIAREISRARAGDPALGFNLAVARFVNWSPSLEALGYMPTWDRDHFVGVLGSLQGKVFTGAYMIPAGPAGSGPKVPYLADHVFTPLWELRSRRPPDGAPCSAWDAFLRRVPLMGDFLRNQVVTDLKYTAVLRDAPDWDTFVLAGPGTKRGLNRMRGADLYAPWKRGEAPLALRSLRERLPSWAAVLRDLNNLSNCMCEFDKYSRVLLGEGTPRARYRPPELR